MGAFYPEAGFPKLVSAKVKADNTLFRPIKPTNPSVPIAYKSQSSFGIIAIHVLYTIPIRPVKPCTGLLNSPNNQS